MKATKVVYKSFRVWKIQRKNVYYYKQRKNKFQKESINSKIISLQKQIEELKAEKKTLVMPKISEYCSIYNYEKMVQNSKDYAEENGLPCEMEQD